MFNTVIPTILTLSAIGALSAVILFLIAKKFAIQEDPRVDEIEQALPGVNCGGCGYAGCRAFAEACMKSADLEGLFCPVGGNNAMAAVAKIKGIEATVKESMIAVVRCNGSFQNRKRTNEYDSAQSCRIVSALFRGETGCEHGCLSLGDCVRSCPFDAIRINPQTGIPEVDETKCTACGNCVKACPRGLIELRKKGPGKGLRVFVSCSNKEKGGVARKNCTAACIACMKCVNICPFDAIKVENFLAYIDFNKCKLCRKCVAECPTGAIHEANFPPRKVTANES